MLPASRCSKAFFIAAGLLIALLGVMLTFYIAHSKFVGQLSISAGTTEHSTAIQDPADPDNPLDSGKQLASIESRLLKFETVLEDLLERHERLAEQFKQSISPAINNTPEDNNSPDLITSLNIAGYTQGEALALMEKQAQVEQVKQWENYRRTFKVKQRQYARLQGTTLPDLLRQEKGDAAYDNYLLSRNLPNRLQFTGVQKFSPAEQAGIEKGDIIYSVDDHRIFHNRDIQIAIHKGQPDELVNVMGKKKDGSLVSYYLPRGPIGVMNLQQVRDLEP